MYICHLGNIITGQLVVILFVFIFPFPKTRVCQYQRRRNPHFIKICKKKRIDTNSPLVEHNRRLDGSLVPHGLQTLSPLLEPVRLVHDTLDLDLAGIEVVDSRREHVGLGEGPDDGDLVAEDLAGRPRDAGRVAVDAINDQFAATADVVDGILEDLCRTGGLVYAC